MKFLLKIEIMQTALSDMLTNFGGTLSNVLKALVIFFIGYIIAKIVAKAIKTALKKIGIDKLGEKLNEIDIVHKANIDIKFSEVISKMVYYIMMLIFTVAATSVLGIPEISDLVTDIINFVPNLIVAIIVLFLGTLLADRLRKFVDTALKSLGVASSGLISSFLFYFLFINIVIVALSQAKIDTSFLSQNISIIIGGIVLAFAIGYGLASKDVMSNIVASFYSKNQFQIGQKVTIDGVTGIISDVSKSVLTIKTETGRVTFPLSQATNTKVEYHD
ncbi:MAG: hypothetical protein ACJATI_003079 [Halioglobus sp.]|jgi:hypothetical protein